jgi:hypothetical protein
MLFGEAQRLLKSLGCNGLVVWCLEENENGAEFYRSHGGADYCEGIETFDHKQLKKIGFIWN